MLGVCCRYIKQSFILYQLSEIIFVVFAQHEGDLSRIYRKQNEAYWDMGCLNEWLEIVVFVTDAIQIFLKLN
jgi:hypothetical protein